MNLFLWALQYDDELSYNARINFNLRNKKQKGTSIKNQSGEFMIVNK